MAEYLKKLRVNSAYTVEELAKLLQVNAMTVYRWESGFSKPSLRHIRALSKIYHVPVKRITEKGML